MRPNPDRKRTIWGAIMALHVRGEPPKITSVETYAGINRGEVYKYYQHFAYHGLLKQDRAGRYYVAQPVPVDQLSLEVLWGAVNAPSANRSGEEPTPKAKPERTPDHELTEKRKVSAVHGSWRKRTPEGVVVTARGQPIVRREFAYRLVTCHLCGRTTIDHHMHQCIAGWQITPHRCVCPSCATGRPPIDA